MMMPEHLGPEQRDRMRADLAHRIAVAKTPEWRSFWEAELLFLNNAGDDAAARLNLLTKAANQDVAIASFISLGEWYEWSHAPNQARQAYEDAIQLANTERAAILARTRLARLHNQTGEPQCAIEVLCDTVRDIDKSPADFVHFVVAEYCQALQTLGRVDDSRALFARVRASFPTRMEISLLEEHLHGRQS